MKFLIIILSLMATFAQANSEIDKEKESIEILSKELVSIEASLERATRNKDLTYSVLLDSESIAYLLATTSGLSNLYFNFEKKLELKRLPDTNAKIASENYSRLASGASKVFKASFMVAVASQLAKKYCFSQVVILNSLEIRSLMKAVSKKKAEIELHALRIEVLQ